MEKNKKIYNLDIIDSDENQSGVEFISIVDDPAIQLLFVKLNKEINLVKPESNESHDDFINRCMPVMIGEGKEQDQSYAICQSIWDNKETKLNLANELDYSWLNDDYLLDTILELASQIGIPANLVGTSYKLDTSIKLYKYTGPISDNSRKFCKKMVNIDRLYTLREIETMSSLIVNPGFGPFGADTYSIRDFKGGCFCKHKWTEYDATIDSRTGLLVTTERVGDAPGLMGTTPDNMPNNARLTLSKVELDKQILVGPFLIPDMEIIRYDENNKPYWIKFGSEAVARIAEKFARTQSNHSIDSDHNEKLVDSYVLESWIVENEQDKINSVYGFNVPIGSWVGKIKVLDNNIWNRVKDGELRGFSVQGNFLDEEEIKSIQEGDLLDRIKRMVSK